MNYVKNYLANLNTDTTKSIFITGGTGFLGSYVIRHLLQKGYTRIRALKRPDSSMHLVSDIARQIEWVEGNVLDIVGLEDALQTIDLVFHCAGLIAFAPRDRKRMMKVNREGTANMVNVALHCGVEKFIHVSSIEALGQKDGTVFTEKTQLERKYHPMAYGLSKYLGEQEVWRGIAEGLNAVIVNPGVILGAGNWDEGALQFFKLGAKGYPLYPTGRSGIVDVHDVARFMIKVAEGPISGERFIVIAENLSYYDLMKQIAAVFGTKSPWIKLGTFLRGLFWRLEWFRATVTRSNPLITRASAKTASVKHEYDHSKSVEMLDFNYTPIQETIKNTVEAFKNQS